MSPHPSEKSAASCPTEVDPLNGDSHPFQRQSDTMLKAIEAACSGEAAEDDENISALFDEEIVESYRELVKLNEVLRHRIRDEENALESAQDLWEEQEEIHRVLEQELEKKSVQRINQKIAAPLSLEQLQEANEKLRDDLRYVTGLIQQDQNKKNNGSTNDAKNDRQLLFNLLERLIARRLDHPDDPYVGVNPEDRDNVNFLRKLWIVQEYKGRKDLVCMIDYAAEVHP
jgi:Centromere-associated protein K